MEVIEHLTFPLSAQKPAFKLKSSRRFNKLETLSKAASFIPYGLIYTLIKGRLFTRLVQISTYI